MRIISKNEILKYFREVDAVVRKIVKDETAPLVLAGVDYLLPLYRSAGDYANLVEAGVPGNPDGLSAQTLHARAWEIVQPYFIKTQEDASARMRQYVGTGLASGDLREIVPAAIQGRVETLFVATGQQFGGILNPAGDRVALQEKAVAGQRGPAQSNRR